eukprot:scaffold9872_cov79-Isochrysis_galbana.AAC.3
MDVSRAPKHRRQHSLPTRPTRQSGQAAAERPYIKRSPCGGSPPAAPTFESPPPSAWRSHPRSPAPPPQPPAR